MADGSPPGDARSLEAVRAQLRDRGYLRGPLARWVLPSRLGRMTTLRIHAAASLRAALIGGPLLGVPAAAAVALAERPRISSPRDLAVLCLYLSGVLGAVLGALELLSDVTLSWLARRGLVLVGRAERLAGRVALLFTVATTLYLASLMRGGRLAAEAGWQGRDGRGGLAWLVWGSAAVVALAVGHLIGRLARLGPLVSLVAATGLPADARGILEPGGDAARRRRWMMAVAAVLLAAGWALVFLPQETGRPVAPAPARFVPAVFEGRILFVGIDGLDAELYERMKRQGACPTLARLERSGARYDLQTISPRVPPLVWTSIATGRPSAEHGILGYQAGRIPGLSAPVQEPPGSPLVLSLRLLLPPVHAARSPVSSDLRRYRTVWEVLADHGVSAAAVNWWATWPAGGSRAIVVSERTLARLAAGLAPDRDVAPETLQRELARRFAADLEEAGRLAREAFGGDPPEGLVQQAALIDAYHALVGRRLLESDRARVLLIYLPGLDIARAAREGAGAPPALRARADASMTGLVRHLDALVGAVWEGRRPADLLVLAADPGREHGAGGTAGVLLVAGDRVVPGRRRRRVSALDLAPTLLALAGFPMARDLPGRPLLEFLRVGDLATRLAVPVDTYGDRPVPAGPRATDPFDEELLDRLRSLGYIH